VHGLFERLARREVVEVADVLAHEDRSADGERDRVLQIRPECEHRRRYRQGRNGLRRKAARAAQDRDALRARAHDRIVEPSRDGPFAREKRVGDTCERGERVVVGIGDRLARSICAGQHEHRRRVCREEQMLYGRVGQDDAEIVVVRRDALEGALRAGQHDRPRGRGQQRFFLRAQFHERVRGSEVTHHERERTFLAKLAFAQREHRGSVRGVARQVVTADAFDGNDCARTQERRRARDRFGSAGGFAARTPGAFVEHVRGTALRAGDRLRVIAAVGRIVVFAPARGAEFPRAHRGVRAIVGQIEDDAVARPAIRAVDVRVRGAPIGRSEEFAHARGANREIGRDARDRRRRAHALANRKRRVSFALGGLEGDRCYLRRGGRLTFEGGEKFVQLRLRRLRMQVHAVARVEHPTGDAVTSCDTVDEGPKPDALHDAGNADAKRLHPGPT